MYKTARLTRNRHVLSAQIFDIDQLEAKIIINIVNYIIELQNTIKNIKYSAQWHNGGHKTNDEFIAIETSLRRRFHYIIMTTCMEDSTESNRHIFNYSNVGDRINCEICGFYL